MIPHGPLNIDVFGQMIR